MRTVGDTRTGRSDRGPILSGMWSASGVLLQYLRKWAGLNQQQLGDAIGYSLE
ncbi:DNA-binding protein [Streptomyces azureus]|uniref:DNA-binding protein n=1 Tax=Streptomyces azureus TaxID=146537 RepID=A0A0K8PRX5_STRAJ|nr:DNA-binding protein [Streptomyces azureus]